MHCFQKLWNNNAVIRLGVGFFLFVLPFIGAARILINYRAVGGWLFVIPALIVLGVFYGLIVKIVRSLPGEISHPIENSPEIERKLAGHKRTEEDLHRVQGHLEDLVRERTMELAALTDIGKALSSTLGVSELL